MPAPDTFPRLLIEHARQRGDRPAIREKDRGIWQTYSWKQVLEQVQSLACGLHTLGLRRGETLAIVGDNRPRLYWAMDAAQALGAIPVPLYQDAVAEEMAYVLSNAEVRIAIVEDQEQVDKLLEVKVPLPAARDDRLRRSARAPALRPDAASRRTRTSRRRAATSSETARSSSTHEVEQGRASDVAIMLYTSGTTGTPKGVMLTHDNLIVTGRGGIQRERLTADEEVLAYLPMAWVGDNLFSYGQGHVAGFCVSCPESPDTVLTDMREIGPTYFFAPPRVLENLLTQVSIRMEDASRFKRWLYARCMAVARRWGPAILEREASAARGAAGLRAGGSPDLRPAAERPGVQPDPGGLHRRRGDRPGSVPVLPIAGGQPQTALREHRDLGLRLHPAQRAGEAGVGRNAGHRRRGAHLRGRARCRSGAPGCSTATSGPRPPPRSP